MTNPDDVLCPRCGEYLRRWHECTERWNDSVGVDVTVFYHPDPEEWVAESSDLGGFIVHGETLGVVREKVREQVAVFHNDGKFHINEWFGRLDLYSDWLSTDTSTVNGTRTTYTRKPTRQTATHIRRITD